MKNIFHIPEIGDIKIVRSRNIKYLSLKLAPGRGIWVNVPYGISLKEAEKFVLSRKEWIRENQTKVKQYENDTGVGLGIGSEIKTKYHTLRIVATNEKRAFYKIEGYEVNIYVPANTVYQNIAKYMEHFLLEIYRVESKNYLPSRVRELAAKHGFKYNKISFRNNISNWGSCSHDDNISLNIKLMKLPDELIDYVILHELCHTIEKNHSEHFWKLLEKVCPRSQTLRAQLRNFNTRI